MYNIIKLYPKLSAISISSALFQIFWGLVVLLNFLTDLHIDTKSHDLYGKILIGSDKT
jgi:hypothetical protein